MTELIYIYWYILWFSMAFFGAVWYHRGWVERFGWLDFINSVIMSGLAWPIYWGMLFYLEYKRKQGDDDER